MDHYGLLLGTQGNPHSLYCLGIWAILHLMPITTRRLSHLQDPILGSADNSSRVGCPFFHPVILWLNHSPRMWKAWIGTRTEFCVPSTWIISCSVSLSQLIFNYSIQSEIASTTEGEYPASEYLISWVRMRSILLGYCPMRVELMVQIPSDLGGNFSEFSYGAIQKKEGGNSVPNAPPVPAAFLRKGWLIPRMGSGLWSPVGGKPKLRCLG